MSRLCNCTPRKSVEKQANWLFTSDFSSPHLRIHIFSEMGRDVPARDVSNDVHCYCKKLTSDVIGRELVKLRHCSF